MMDDIPLSSSPSLGDEVKNNEIRCRRILACKQQIKHWQDKMRSLEKEQEKYIKLARLRLDAPSTWRLLSRRERREKDFILAALESPELPEALEDFENGTFPSHIRLDRDILIARVSRQDFAKSVNGDSDLFVPPKLRNDKALVLEIVKHCPNAIEFVSNELKDDGDILRAILNRSKLPAHFLQHFSETLRSDADVMLEVLSHPNNGLSSMAYCSSVLRNDKSFFLSAVAFGNHQADGQVLRFASQRLKDDPEVVLHCVRQSGMNLKHASYDLRRDQEIVSEASKQDPASFRYCLPGIVKQTLLEHSEFAKKVVQHLPLSGVKHCLELYECDEEVVLFALRNPCVEWCMIPDHFRKQLDFVAKAVHLSNGSIWEDLPMETKCNFPVALALVTSPSTSEDLAMAAFAICPELFSSHKAMMCFIANHGGGDLLPMVLDSFPLSIRSDKELMMKAIKKDVSIWEHCSDELKVDRDIALAALEGSPNVLFFIGESYQMDNPAFVVLTIETHARYLQFVYHDVCKELWSNREVARAWLNSGGDWLDEFPEEFAEDEELVLILVRKNWSDFNMISDALKGDKDFILKAVAVDARIIRDVDEKIAYDKDVALAAISKDPRSLQFYSGGEAFEFIVSFAKLIRERLLEYQVFQKEIVASMDKECHRSNQISVLSMLNQGPATLAMYKDVITSYIGVLHDEEEIAKYCAVSNHLASWGL
ncbi:unnamed protein product [Cylindrotheca closterium]|uniref:DUF4116 domain-containing protein n=1 Tax=Cylindrotheca closterium TaxID=2856 RepID=A0AAD2FV94_9STRA|nr:unnamed protein product [Cylindrotheca closterium]